MHVARNNGPDIPPPYTEPRGLVALSFVPLRKNGDEETTRRQMLFRHSAALVHGPDEDGRRLNAIFGCPRCSQVNREQISSETFHFR